MTTFFTADQHFGHANILTYANRPFANLEDMTAALTENWLKTVGPDDVVWVLGDIAIDGQFELGLETLSALPGHKRLVVGNHDRCSPTRTFKDVVAYQGMYQQVFEAVVQFARIKLAGQRVMLSHYPYGNDPTDDRYPWARLVDAREPLLCGHIHNAWERKRTPRGTWQFNVGVDVRNFTPVSEDEVASWLN